MTTWDGGCYRPRKKRILKARHCVCCDVQLPDYRQRKRKYYCDRCAKYVLVIQQRAMREVAAAVRRGELLHVREHICLECNIWTAVHYEHRHYSKPLEVTPLCQGCNNKRGPALDVRELVAKLRVERPELALPDKPSLNHSDI